MLRRLWQNGLLLKVEGQLIYTRLSAGLVISALIEVGSVLY
jgi:hypothetical protein